MNNKEVNIRSIIFLLIGIILIVSLIICVYIISSERDLVHTMGETTKVVENSNSKGDNDVTVSYDVDGKTYNYNFYYKEDIKEGDKIDIYYHKKDVSKVQTYKTSYFIFVCPTLGLLLCLLGLVDTFKKNEEDNEKLYETQVLHISDKTQQLSIITNDEKIEYEKLPEEVAEPKISKVKKTVEKTKVKKDTKRIVPVYYYLSKNSVVYEIRNKEELEEIRVEDIDRVVQEIGKNGKLSKIIIYANNLEYHLMEVKNINIVRFNEFLQKKLVSVNKDYKEEIVNR